MLCARTVFSFLAQGVVAAIYALRSLPAPWHDAARWLPVYATLIDGGCLLSLWTLTRKEGIALTSLIGFDRTRWRRDVLLGLVVIPFSLAVIIAGVRTSSYFVFGSWEPPTLYQPLPLPAAIYAVVVFPALWGVTEQMTYNGYLVPRFQVLSGSTAIAAALVVPLWSFQHALLPTTFQSDFMLYRTLAAIPNSLFFTLLYLRVRRLLPFVIAHWLMDGADAFLTLLLPLIA
jgi:membrane protease YdiL (CAAX protease family)